MKNTILRSVVRLLFWLYISLSVVGVLHYVRRIFIAERFNIPTESMSPTLVSGDKIWVNKLLYGGRIYTSFDFKNNAELKCFRMPGIRKIRTGDVICFNYPYGNGDLNKIEFKINYVYCKRVLGTPGDRVGAVDGHCWNDKVFRPIGVVEEQDKLRWMYDSVFIWNNNYFVFPSSGYNWNIKNWGPLIVPSKGMTVTLDDHSRSIYRIVIEYETGCEIDKNLTEYTFKHDYYFALGDNSMSSWDSRYWGFIPDDFIIGIVAGH